MRRLIKNALLETKYASPKWLTCRYNLRYLILHSHINFLICSPKRLLQMYCAVIKTTPRESYKYQLQPVHVQISSDHTRNWLITDV